jgi:hypothetical protein
MVTIYHSTMFRSLLSLAELSPHSREDDDVRLPTLEPIHRRHGQLQGSLIPGSSSWRCMAPCSLLDAALATYTAVMGRVGRAAAHKWPLQQWRLPGAAA